LFQWVARAYDCRVSYLIVIHEEPVLVETGGQGTAALFLAPHRDRIRKTWM